LLLIGLPLTIALGFVFGLLVYGDLTWIQLALLATMLAPTDAALGKAVISNEAVPSSVREGLNVESGLNDGICVPVLLLFLSLAGTAGDQGSVTAQMVHLMLEEIGIGALVGIPFAVIGSSVIKDSTRRGWIAGSWMQMPVISLALLCFATAQWLGGSGFIASFAGGMTFGAMIKERKEELLEAAEGTGDVLAMITWFVFGAMFIGDSLRNPEWQAVVYAVLSLTIIRMVPVFLCVLGAKIHWDTKLFLGWFGPRGLASIVFVVMVKQANIPGTETLIQAVTWTVLLSVIAHGITANPFAKAYAGRVNSRDGAV
jgi:NhaP-type Na+/H+ or K+/H+ antiporter